MTEEELAVIEASIDGYVACGGSMVRSVVADLIAEVRRLSLLVAEEQEMRLGLIHRIVREGAR
jgi:hypothetical protein